MHKNASGNDRAALVRDLKDLIAHDETSIAIARLKEIFQKEGLIRYFNEVVLLSNQLSEITSEKRKGLSAPAEYQIQKAKINNAVLDLIDLYAHGNPLPEQTSPSAKKQPAGQTKKRWGFVLIAALLSIILLFFVWRNGLNNFAGKRKNPTVVQTDNLPGKNPQSSEPGKNEKTNESEEKKSGKKEDVQIKYDLTGKWSNDKLFDSYSVIAQSGNSLTFQLFREGKMQYEGRGTIQGEKVNIRYQWQSGPGRFVLNIRDGGKTLQGFYRNQLTQGKEEPITMYKMD
jgi:hypothetical protein